MPTDRSIATKMQVKPGNDLVLLGASPQHRALLEPLPDDVTTTEGLDGADPDVAVMFAEDRVSLDQHLDEALQHLGEVRAVWVAYPKANKTDINRDSIWRRAEELGWTLNGNVSVSAAWSAVRIKPQS